MKKLLLIALVVGGIAFATAPRTEARTFVSVGIGFPVGFGYYGCGYPYYGYRPYYPYGYYRPYPYYAVGYNYYYGRPYYWHHGRRIYYGRRVR